MSETPREPDPAKATVSAMFFVGTREPDSSPPPAPSPTTTPALLCADPVCGHEYRDHAFGAKCRHITTAQAPGELNLSPCHCRAFVDPPSAPPAPAPASEQQDQRHAGSTMKNQQHEPVLSREATGFSSSDLDALDMLARAVSITRNAQPFDSSAYRIAKWAYEAAFGAYGAGPERVAQLVVAARAGLKDAARLDYLEDCDGLEWDAVPARCYNDELTVRQSIDAARASRPPSGADDAR